MSLKQDKQSDVCEGYLAIQITDNGRNRLDTYIGLVSWVQASLGGIQGYVGLSNLFRMIMYMDKLTELHIFFLQLAITLISSSAAVSALLAVISRYTTTKSCGGRIAYTAQGVYAFITFFNVGLTIALMIIINPVSEVATNQVMDTMFRGISLYLEDPTWKTNYDNLHQGLRCCGVLGPQDWYRVSWIKIKHLRPDIPLEDLVKRNGQMSPFVVPASCCNPDTLYPCLHDALQQNDSSALWTEEPVTPPFVGSLFTLGCVGPLVDPILNSLWLFRAFCAVISVLQVVTWTLTRYHFTASINSLYVSDPREPVPAYIIHRSTKPKPMPPTIRTTETPDRSPRLENDLLLLPVKMRSPKIRPLDPTKSREPISSSEKRRIKKRQPKITPLGYKTSSFTGWLSAAKLKKYEKLIKKLNQQAMVSVDNIQLLEVKQSD